jgi:hypothetical protein
MKWLPILFDSVPTYDRGLRLVQHVILSLFFVSFNYLHKKNKKMNTNNSYMELNTNVYQLPGVIS